jgi:hypothetical protein
LSYENQLALQAGVFQVKPATARQAQLKLLTTAIASSIRSTA